jgi:Flp pilus assembly protein TadD
VALAVCSRFEEAVDPLTRALAVGEESVEIRYRLGLSHLQLGHDEMALPHLRRCIELDPGEAIPYRYLGLIADRAGETAQAIARYRKFLDLYHGDALWSDSVRARLRELEGGALR